MSRVRVIGLVALGVLAVVLFLVAPEEGRFSQTPTLVLVGVIALLWHLAWTDAVDASAGTTPAASTDEAGASRERAASAPVAERTVAAHVAAVPTLDDEEEDLSLLPDPPADWPPPGVEVPMVFRAESVEVEVVDLTDRTDPVDAEDVRIDLTGDVPERIDLTPEVATATADVAEPSLRADAEPSPQGDAEPDPWLAFAASMFRDD